MTEADQRLIHAYVTEGACWHSRKWNAKTLEITCRHCGKGNYEIECNPDYSTRQHFPDLTAKLFGDEGMWGTFRGYSYNKWLPIDTARLYHMARFEAWLFSDYARFVALFAAFLRLPETVREYGYQLCDDRDFNPDGICVTDINLDCPIEGGCNYTGKIPKRWAKLVEEGKS